MSKGDRYSYSYYDCLLMATDGNWKQNVAVRVDNTTTTKYYHYKILPLQNTTTTKYYHYKMQALNT